MGKEVKVAEQQIPFVRFIPSIVTFLAMCCGLTAIKFALMGKFENSIYMIVIAAILDGLDGRLARALSSTSSFGAELDSLCDLVNFGVAPAITIYLWGLKDVKFFGWLTVMFLVIAMAARLARFNAILIEDKPSAKGEYFLGVPAPLGGMLIMLPIMFYIEFENFVVPSVFWTIYCFIVGLLMVSTVPTFSAKSIKINKSNAVMSLGFFAMLVAALASDPIRTLLMLLFAYLITMPFVAKKHWKKH
jgi:CDP-diacylglycerol--serine O-phosphatidyltransferase